MRINPLTVPKLICLKRGRSVYFWYPKKTSVLTARNITGVPAIARATHSSPAFKPDGKENAKQASDACREFPTGWPSNPAAGLFVFSASRPSGRVAMKHSTRTSTTGPVSRAAVVVVTLKMDGQGMWA